MKQKRRVRIYYVEPTHILELFTSWNRVDYVALPRFRNIPDDSEILSCIYNLDSQCFFFLVYHESFDKVPEGERAPRFAGDYEVVHLDKRDRRKG